MEKWRVFFKWRWWRKKWWKWWKWKKLTYIKIFLFICKRLWRQQSSLIARVKFSGIVSKQDVAKLGLGDHCLVRFCQVNVIAHELLWITRELTEKLFPRAWSSVVEVTTATFRCSCQGCWEVLESLLCNAILACLDLRRIDDTIVLWPFA